MNIISKILRYLKKHFILVKNIIMLTLVGVVVVLFATTLNYKSLYNEQIELVHSNKSESADLVEENAELNVEIQEHQKQLEAYRTEVEELRAENQKLKSTNTKLNKQLANNVTYPDKEYVQSTAVWNHLKGLGLNDYVCAGILGNIMAEVGGHTLDISLYSARESAQYYGICQWAGGRKQRLLNEYGRTLSDQLEFLSVELFEVIPEDNSFYDMQNEKEAALYFAKYYERCSSKYYAVRQTNATKALEYFTA